MKTSIFWDIMSVERRPTFRRSMSPPKRRLPFKEAEGVKLTTHLLVPRSRMVELYLHTPTYIFMARFLIKHRDNLPYSNGIIPVFHEKKSKNHIMSQL
jgi:hypothetical protein